MRYKTLLFFSLFLVIAGSLLYAENAPTADSDQQISDFSLAGYGEKGKKTWDLSGKSADIFSEIIKLKDIIGNLYGEKEEIKLTADKGDFNKDEGRLKVEDNVIITTSSGSKLTTDTLEWDRKNNIVTTHALVNVERENMLTTATGATGYPNLNKISFDKDVTVKFTPEAKDKDGEDNNIVITCDGPLEIDYAKNFATFKNKVRVETQGNVIYSDVMDIYFLSQGQADNKDEKTEAQAEAESALMGSKIDKIVARGNVKIVRGENVSYSEEATYIARDKKIILTGRPKLIIYSTEGFNASLRN